MSYTKLAQSKRIRRQRPTKQDYAQTAAHTRLRTHTFALHIAKVCADGGAHALAHAYFCFAHSKSMRRQRRTKQKYAQTEAYTRLHTHTFFLAQSKSMRRQRRTKQKYAQTEAPARLHTHTFALHTAKACADGGARTPPKSGQRVSPRPKI